MIVKLTKSGGITRLIESTDILCQPVVGGRVDIEIAVRSGSPLRFLIGEEGPAVDVITADTIWDRAYIMENSKTVDVIRGHRQPS